MKSKKIFAPIVVIILAIIIPSVIQSSYIQYICSLLCIYGVLAMAINLLMGIGGQTSLGNAAFAAIGAYAAAIFYNMGVPFYICMLIAGAICAIVGFIIGLPSVRLSGHYLAVATMGFGVAIPQIALQWESLTGGAMGMNVGRIALFGMEFDSDIKYYYLNLFILIIVFITIRNIIKSRYGRKFAAIRDSETVAQAMGVNLMLNKTFMFAISAFYSGIAGAMYVFTLRFISYSSFSLISSFNLVTMIVLGGIGTIVGPIIGAGIFIILDNLARSINGASEVISGLILVIMILFCPDGIMGIYENIKARIKRSRAQRSVGKEGTT